MMGTNKSEGIERILKAMPGKVSPEKEHRFAAYLTTVNNALKEEERRRRK